MDECTNEWCSDGCMIVLMYDGDGHCAHVSMDVCMYEVYDVVLDQWCNWSYSVAIDVWLYKVNDVVQYVWCSDRCM